MAPDRWIVTLTGLPLVAFACPMGMFRGRLIVE
jgi:hypothetical protein